MYGDGGTGKSLLALQAVAAVATGSPFLGQKIERPGPVCVIAAEDELDELHRRFADICRESDIAMADLDNLFIRSVAGEDSMLAEATRNGSLKATEFYKRLERVLSERQYSLLVLDTLSHLMAGNENDKNHATLLKHLAIKHNCAVLLLAHPSMNGMNTGTGTSGNTGWSNAARSRLYLERIKNKDGEEEDTDARVLRTMKSNYGPTGGEIRMTWQRGIFVADAELSDDDEGSRPPSDDLFLELLDTYTEQNRYVSPNRSSSYAPTLFEEHPKAKARKAHKHTFAAAMERLLASGDIIIAEHGKGASKRTHLERATNEPPRRNRRRCRENEELV